MKKRIISFLLSIIIVCGGAYIPSISFANENVMPTYKTAYCENINGEFESVSKDEFYQDFQSADYSLTASYSDDILEFTDAAVYLSKQMEQRISSITVKSYFSDSDFDSTQYAAYKALFNRALDEDIATSTTTGDYLHWHAGGYLVRYNTYTQADGRTYLYAIYTMRYYTTAEQEVKTTQVINDALDSLNLEGESDWNKVLAIHDYISLHTTYDNANLEDDTDKYKYTSYGCLYQGLCVCQGYANTFARMCEESGVACRTIAGYSSGSNHAWNSVKVDNVWYWIDVTWDDADDGDKIYYNYFLKCTESFANHTPREEYDSYLESIGVSDTDCVCQHKMEVVKTSSSNCENGLTYTLKCKVCKESENGGTIDEGSNHILKTVVTNPTCTEQGYTTTTCQYCSFSNVSNYVDAKGHTFVDYVSNENATCTDDGTKTGKCEFCKTPNTIEDTNSALGHSFVAYTSDGNATCTEDGTKTTKCERCDVKSTLTDEGSCLGHNFDNYISDGNATCTEDGTKTAKCSRCEVKSTISDENSKLYHHLLSTVTEPTCTEKGYTTYDCSRCDYSVKSNYVPLLGHNYIETIVSNNQCEIDGEKSYECSRCHDSYSKVIPAHGHNYISQITTPVTCIDSGVITYTCSYCNDYYTEDIAPVGHSHSYSGKVPAKIGEYGKIIYTCDLCGDIQTSTINKIASIKLSTIKYTYDGKIKAPSVIVKDASGKTLVKGIDYTLAYASGRKSVGRYSVKVTFKGNYSGSKTLYFTIVPKTTSISKLTATKAGFVAVWKNQQTQTTGYQIQYSTSSKFASPKTVTVTKNKTLTKTISKIKSKKKYYVRVRTYKVVNSKKYYSSWSTKKYVITK